MLKNCTSFLFTIFILFLFLLFLVVLDSQFSLDASSQHLNLIKKFFLIFNFTIDLKKCRIFSNPQHNFLLQNYIIVFTINKFIFFSQKYIICIFLYPLIFVLCNLFSLFWFIKGKNIMFTLDWITMTFL